jgi:Domain of unknown function (DUF4288)
LGSSDMKWYVAELIVECRVGRERANLWDRQIVVLRAETSEEAYDVAVKLGKKQNSVYLNAEGKKVHWRFKGLGNLDQLTSKAIRSGTEIHSELNKRKLPRVCPKHKLTVFWFERNLHKKAGDLLSDNLREVFPR